jgi:LPS sulfotransferase NodH
MTENRTRPRFAIILGSPRSGTTWLQRMLAAHPQVATPQETHLFALYLAPMANRWFRQERNINGTLNAISAGDNPAARILGLPTLLEQTDVDEAMRSLLDALLDRSAAAGAPSDPSAPPVSLVLEKTPSNALHVDLINRLAPDCLFVHLIRDPRDVAASLLAASKDWGGRWAARNPESAARMWTEHVEGGRRAAAFGDRYMELRYEDMKADTPAQVKQVLDFLGMDSSQATELAKEQGDFAFRPDIQARLGATTYEPEAFSGGGKVRHSLTAGQQMVVERHTAELRAELGYGETARWKSPSKLRTMAMLPGQEVASVSRRTARKALLRAVGGRSVPGVIDAEATRGSAAS